MKKIVFNKPCIGEGEIAAVARVLKRGWLIGGEEVKRFEKDFAAYIGAKYAVAVTSGTAAIHLSLLALGIQKGDEVILPTYISSDLLNAIFYVGATPIIVDIRENSCLINTSHIEKKITKKTKVMIIPHTFGLPVDISSLVHFGIPIIEDCAQAIGTTWQGKRVGTFSEMSIFSFFVTKLLATGQGGMVLTNSKKIYTLVKDLIHYNGRDNYIIRFNYPLTDIAASIGNIQLSVYPSFLERRKYIARCYQDVLEEKHIFHLPQRKDQNSAPFRFLFRCENGKRLEEIVRLFAKNDIEVKRPIMPYELLHRLLRKDKKAFPGAEHFANTMLALPIYPCLKERDVEKITSTMAKIL